MHPICYEKMVQKKPISNKETHASNSLMFSIGNLITNDAKPKDVYDRLYNELSKTQIISSDFLQEILLIICQDPGRLKEYWLELKDKIVTNIKESRDADFFKSERKTEKLLRIFPEKECFEIRSAITDMREKSISDDETTENQPLPLIN